MPDPSTRSATPGQALPFEVGRTYAEKAVLFELHREKKKGETIHARALASRLTMPERLVRQCVSNLVDLGEPVCSSPAKGYWIAQTQEDFDECIASLMRRAAKIFKRAWTLKKGATYEEMTGHLKLALEEKNGS